MRKIKKYNIINKGKTGKIYLYLFGEPKAKNEIKKELKLRNDDVYIKNSAFEQLLKNDYIIEVGKNKKDKQIFQSSCKPLIEIIKNKLQMNNKFLTSSEEIILKNFLDSESLRDLFKKFYQNWFTNAFNSFDIIIESFFINFIFHEYICQKTLFDHNTMLKIRKYILTNQNNLKSDPSSDLLLPLFNINVKQVSQLFLPDFLQEIQIQQYSKIPKNLDFFED